MKAYKAKCKYCGKQFESPWKPQLAQHHETHEKYCKVAKKIKEELNPSVKEGDAFNNSEVKK